MDVKALNKENTEILFKGLNPALINTLRRLATSEVPCLAIEDIEVVKNGSAMYDEMLAHRLGLVPLVTDLKSYNLKEDCKCKGKGCSMCQLVLTLDVKGPAMVYSGDIKSKDPKIKAVHDKIPIVNLLKGQELKLNMIAVMGKGKDHMKFSPGLMFYRGYPEIKAGAVKNAEKVAASCPVKILEANSGKIKVTDNEKCVLCNACVEASNGEIEVKGNNEDFIVTIEPWGQLEPKEILAEAVKIFDAKLNEFEKEVKKIK